MASPPLPPPVLVEDDDALERLVGVLASHPIVAVDTESNSLHAYRERVCLIQCSTPEADYIVDPIPLTRLDALAPLFANPDQQKVLHAAENDILGLRRDYGFAFSNIFDTASAARALGWPQVGLAAILDRHFGVTLDKSMQRSDWRRRPLTPRQLDYARLDTHYLIALRDTQWQALGDAGYRAEAEEDFARISRVGSSVSAPETDGTDPNDARPSDTAFWRVKGARDLSPAQAAILQAVFAYRERQAERIDRPPFMVMHDATLLALALRSPRTAADLADVPGLSPRQIARHRGGLLQAISEGRQTPPRRPPPLEREPDEVRERYERLQAWRKRRARARGVESDVILSRTTLQDLARRPPRTRDDLERVVDFGPWRRQTYGEEILALLAGTGPC